MRHSVDGLVEIKGKTGNNKKVAFAGPWIGEFAWEFMTWVPYLRKLSRKYDKMYISTFEGMEALYRDFHCELEFTPHSDQVRTDDWVGVDLGWNNPQELIEPVPIKHIRAIKEYKIDGEYVRYGSPVIKNVGVLFHARGIEKGAEKNWSRDKWEKLAKEFPGAMSIGSTADLHVPGTVDARSTRPGLENLMNTIASAAIVIGGSSGVMHLAAMCGTPVAAWGDCNNFGDTLKNRYMETWNPFGSRVTWIGDTWDPDPEQIMEALKPKRITPAPDVLKSIHAAAQSGHYMVAVAYVGEKDGKPAIISPCSNVNFPDNLLPKAVEDMGKSINGAISTAQAERIPVSWY